jgi:hypothetical protein
LVKVTIQKSVCRLFPNAAMLMVEPLGIDTEPEKAHVSVEFAGTVHVIAVVL